MQPLSRHQCLIYSGSPARHLPALAALIRRKLEERHRCLYLDSPPMVAGIRSYLSAAGVEVAREVGKGSLIGFIGGDAETNFISNGSTFTSFSVATQRSWKNSEGAWESRTEWHR